MPKSKRTKWLFMAGVIAVAAAIGCDLFQSEVDSTKGSGRSVTLVDPKAVHSDAVFLFWYGCPHCRAVEDIFAREDAGTKFQKALDNGDRLEMIPVPINQVWEIHARLFFALSHVNVSPSTHRLMMKTIQDEGLTTKDSMRVAIKVAISAESSQGHAISASEDAILDDLFSARTNDQIASAKSLVSQVGLKGVPTLLLKKKTLLELGNGVTYESFLPGALAILNKGARHE